MLFDIPFIADWKKIGEHRQRQQILTLPVKIRAGLIMITKLVKKHLHGTIVFSPKQNPGI
jgi:hypothetical protein